MSSDENNRQRGEPMRRSSGRPSRRPYLRARTGTGGRPRPRPDPMHPAPPVGFEAQPRAATLEEVPSVPPGFGVLGPNVGALFQAPAARGITEATSPPVRGLPGPLEQILAELSARERGEREELQRQLHEARGLFQQQLEEKDARIRELLEVNEELTRRVSALNEENAIQHKILKERGYNMADKSVQTDASKDEENLDEIKKVVECMIERVVEAEPLMDQPVVDMVEIQDPAPPEYEDNAPPENGDDDPPPMPVGAAANVRRLDKLVDGSFYNFEWP